MATHPLLWLAIMGAGLLGMAIILFRQEFAAGLGWPAPQAGKPEPTRTDQSDAASPLVDLASDLRPGRGLEVRVVKVQLGPDHHGSKPGLETGDVLILDIEKAVALPEKG